MSYDITNNAGKHTTLLVTNGSFHGSQDGRSFHVISPRRDNAQYYVQGYENFYHPEIHGKMISSYYVWYYRYEAHVLSYGSY